MRAEAGMDDHTIETRLEAAAKAWEELWAGGGAYEAQTAETLPHQK